MSRPRNNGYKNYYNKSNHFHDGCSNYSRPPNAGSPHFMPPPNYNVPLPSPHRYPPSMNHNVGPYYPPPGLPDFNRPPPPVYGNNPWGGVPLVPHGVPPVPHHPLGEYSPSCWQGQPPINHFNNYGMDNSFGPRGPPHHQNFGPSFQNSPNGYNNNNKRKFNNNQGNYNKKPKIDKRELPENNQFSCVTCNRGFKTEDIYDDHIKSHKKCQVEGCEFSAHPKLVQMHYESQHLTGYDSKIVYSYTPEEIEQWREERKRNFPSQENKDRKEKERQERIERGEEDATRRCNARRNNSLKNDKRKKFQEKKNRKKNSDENVRPIPVSNELPENVVTEAAPAKEIIAETSSGEEEGEGQTIITAASATVATSFVDEKENSQKPKKTKKFPGRKRQTTLEALVANQTKQEQNQVLQCIRYILRKLDAKEQTDKKLE